jgi:hypothetical protein
VAYTWRIPLEVVQEYKTITNFKASWHKMWIQAKRDPNKEWLSMRYCITIEEVQWEMKDLPKEWNIPVEQPKDKQPAKDKQPTKDKISTEVGSSQRKSTPTTNTRETTGRINPTGGAQQQRKRLSRSQSHNRRITHNLLMAQHRRKITLLRRRDRQEGTYRIP